MLYHIVAIANNRVIGKDNRLPWHFSADLKHFKQITMGQTLLMGRKTFESIYQATNGKMLPGRDINFLTKAKKLHNVPFKDFAGMRVFYYDNLDEALKGYDQPGTDLYIIGGASLYQQTLSRIDGIYLTQIHADYEGDTFYPEIPSHFKEKSRENLQENPLIEVIFLARA